MRRAQLIGLVGIVVVSGLWATPVAGQETSNGNELLRNCGHYLARSPGILEYGGAMYCMGLIRGVGAVNQAFSSRFGLALCMPVEANTEQALRVVVRYLEENPEKLHLPDIDLVVEALIDAFPCSP